MPKKEGENTKLVIFTKNRRELGFFMDYENRVFEVPHDAAGLAALWDWNDARINLCAKELVLTPSRFENSRQQGVALASRVAQRFPHSIVLLSGGPSGVISHWETNAPQPVPAAPVPSSWCPELGIWVTSEDILNPVLELQGHNIVIRVLPSQERDSLMLTDTAGESLTVNMHSNLLNYTYRPSASRTGFLKSRINCSLDQIIDYFLKSPLEPGPKKARSRRVQPATSITELESQVTRLAFRKSLDGGGPDGIFTPEELPSLVTVLRERLTIQQFEILNELLEQYPDTLSSYPLLRLATSL